MFSGMDIVDEWLRESGLLFNISVKVISDERMRHRKITFHNTILDKTYETRVITDLELIDSGIDMKDLIIKELEKVKLSVIKDLVKS